MWQTDILKKYKALKLEIESMYQPPSQDDLFKIIFGGKTESGKPFQKYAIIMPRLPKASDKDALKGASYDDLKALIADIPVDVTYEFIEAMKPSTSNRLKYLLQSAMIASADSKTNGRHLTLNVMPMPGKDMEEYAKVWADINEELLGDGFYDTWEISCGDMKLYCNRKIMEERRKNEGIRDISILDEDILNLKIALGATQDVNEFLALLEAK